MTKENDGMEPLDKFPWSLDPDKLEAQGLKHYLGFVHFVGKVQGGHNYVQFDATSKGWRSYWPDWAYEIARDALYHNKQLVVVAKGDPVGENLHTVWIQKENLNPGLIEPRGEGE